MTENEPPSSQKNLMQVTEIKQEAHILLDELRKRIPNISAAHFIGSINDYGESDSFPVYLDVDLVIIQENTERDPATSLPYPGLLRDNDIYFRKESLLFECVYFSNEAYLPQEHLLSSSSLTHALAHGERTILYDPAGFIAKAIETVQKKAFTPEWIKRRCLDQEQYARGALQSVHEFEIPAEKILSLGWIGIYLSGMIAEALKQAPTHRRALVNLKQFCSEHNQENLYHQLLKVLGYDRVNASEINALTNRFSQIIDRAIEVKRTPIPYSFKVTPGIHDYITQGTQEISQEGHPNEAAFWVVTALLITGAILLNDAPEQEKPAVLKDFSGLIDLLGMNGTKHWQERLDDAERIIGEFTSFAQSLLES